MDSGQRVVGEVNQAANAVHSLELTTARFCLATSSWAGVGLWTCQRRS